MAKNSIHEALRDCVVTSLRTSMFTVIYCYDVGGHDYHTHDDSPTMIFMITMNLHFVPRLPAHQWRGRNMNLCQ